MNSRVDRSLASIPRRTFLKTAALAGLSPLAFAQANQDKDKDDKDKDEHKNGRLFVFVGESDFSPEPTDPSMTGMFAIDPESGVWERIATPEQAVGWYFSSMSPNDGTIAVSPTSSSVRGVWIFDPAHDMEPKRIIDKRPVPMLPPLWSSDGRRLLASFSIKGRENDAAFETFSFRRDGSGLEKIPLAETDVALAWSLKDLSLLVASAKDLPPITKVNRAYYWPIEFVNIDGKGRRRVVEVRRDHLLFSVCFNPDGRSFAYLDWEPTKGSRPLEARLSIVDLETDKRRRLLKDEDTPAAVHWSADGKTLAVLLDQRAYKENGALDRSKVTRWIELIDLDGKNRRKIELPFKVPYLCDWR